MDKAVTYFYIAVGSALGGMGRFWVSGLVAQRVGRGFPWGTLFVNLSGSFLIGLFAAWVATGDRLTTHARFREFFMVGICGGYTTFSAFSLESLNLLRDGEWIRAVAYVGLSVALCLLGVWLGCLAGQTLNR